MAKVVAEKEEKKISSNEAAEAFLKKNKANHFVYESPENKLIPTGSLQLDSIVKTRSGSTIRFTGKGFELGKSSQAFVFADNFMKEMAKSKTLYVKAEARLTPEMQKRTGLKFVTDVKDWDYGTVFIFPCNIFETVAEFIESQLKITHDLGERLCIIVDSLDGLMLEDDYKTKGYKDATVVAGVQKLTKLMFRRLALPINYYDAMLLMTSQYSVAIQLDKYNPIVSQTAGGGGSSVGHQSDYIFEYSLRYKSDNILEDPDAQPDMYKNKIIGVYSTVEIKKGSTDASGTKIKIPIKKGRIGCAIWIEKEVVDMVVGFGFVEKSGSWLTFTDNVLEEAKAAKVDIKEKIQGISQLYQYLENNRPVFEFLYTKVKKMIE